MKKIIFKKNCTISIILRVLCGEEPSRVRVIDVCKRFTSNLNYILLLSNNTANIFSTRKLNEVWVDSGGSSTMDLWGEKCSFSIFVKNKNICKYYNGETCVAP